jgi:hypothetical protein
VTGARYLALGDSYTIGEGAGEHERWPAQLSQTLRSHGTDVTDPCIIARTGWTTEELLTAIDDSGVDGKWDLVTLLAGVNDQYRGYGERRFARDLRRVAGAGPWVRETAGPPGRTFHTGLGGHAVRGGEGPGGHRQGNRFLQCRSCLPDHPGWRSLRRHHSSDAARCNGYSPARVRWTAPIRHHVSHVGRARFTRCSARAVRIVGQIEAPPLEKR